MEWSKDLREIRSELGEEEIASRMDTLSLRMRTESIVTAYDLTLTLPQVTAFYNLAEALGGIVIDQSIRRSKNAEELAWEVCNMERLRRKNP
jgi:hypothetical protein